MKADVIRRRSKSGGASWKSCRAVPQSEPLRPGLPRALPALWLTLWLGVTLVRGAVPTLKQPVTNEYHGVKVVDEYQWLENGTNPAVRAWSAAQNQQARAALDALPTRPWVADRLARLLNQPLRQYSSFTWQRDRLFCLKFQPPAQQPVLVTLNSFTNLSSERVIVDPNRAGAKGSTTIDWYVPSPDGKRVAVSLSENGSEIGTLFVYDAATGQPQPDRIPRVQGPTAGGSAAWNADGTGLYYTRYPRAGERPPADMDFYQQVYFHRLGTSADRDVYELGKELPRIAEIQLQASPDGRYLLASVANGDGGEYAHFLRSPDGKWRQITQFADKVVQAEFGRDPLYIEAGKDDALYLLSRQKASRGKLLRLPLASPALSRATVVLPEGKSVIADFHPTASGLALKLVEGGPSDFAFYDFAEKKLRRPRDTSVSTVQEIAVMRGDDILYRDVSYTHPSAWWHYNPSDDRPRVESTPFTTSSPVDFGDVEAVRESVSSKDGTKVPLNIIRKKGARLNGDNPTLLTGYGGFGISVAPTFDASRRLWLDQGGVIAVANLRGGGEFGEDWHLAGNLTNKQHVFDDFAACAQFLVRSNYTRPGKLAVEGGSNGGLLIGAFVVQHPDLARAAVAHVGLFDMLRTELDPNGAFNVTEYGTVRDPAQFRALYAYSPYHHVADNTSYPALLLMTGDNDGRVNPAHSRKMTARLQAATSSKLPVLLRTSAATGHGIGTALGERIQELADVYAFLFEQLGIDYSLVERGPWSGAITPTSAVVKAQLVREGLRARVLASKSPLLLGRVYSNTAVSETNRDDVVGCTLSNLEPATRYFYAVEVNGRVDTATRGELSTFPLPGPASFQFAFASCAHTGSTSDVFDTIRACHPLFFLHMGDFHYLDIQTDSRARFRAAYASVLASPEQAEMYRQVPLAYIWDDHDFGGNNSYRRSPAHDAARFTYEEWVPHYPLAFGHDGPISQSFSVGRVKFILTDLRSQRDRPSAKDGPLKSMMGEAQKAWFKRELLQANGRYPLICWMSTVPWIGTAGANVYRQVPTNQFGWIHHTNLVARTNAPGTRGTTNSPAARPAPPPVEDYWSVFATERRELADFIKTNHIAGLCILHGDSHMLAADDGRNSDYATGGGAPLPVMCAAPLDQEPSLKGGPYSQGVYRVRKGEGAFGLVSISDRGDHLDVSFSGRNDRNEEKIALRFTVPAVNPMARPQ